MNYETIITSSTFADLLTRYCDNLDQYSTTELIKDDCDLTRNAVIFNVSASESERIIAQLHASPRKRQELFDAGYEGGHIGFTVHDTTPEFQTIDCVAYGGFWFPKGDDNV